MLTGESSPVYKTKEQKVVGGTILIDGNLKCEVRSLVDNTVLAKIIELVRNAQEDKPEIQQLGDKISHYFIIF